MNEINENMESYGEVDIIIENVVTGKKTITTHKNKGLRVGKEKVVASLANQINSSFDFYIANALIGTSGTSGGTPKVVEDTRTGLFGSTLLTKPVITSIDPNNLRKISCTFVITTSEANGSNLNEFLLQLKSGEAFAMISRGDIAKDSSTAITVNWRISYL